MTKPTIEQIAYWLSTAQTGQLEGAILDVIRDKLIAAEKMKAALEQYTQCVSSVNDPNDFTPRMKDEGEAARLALSAWEATE